MSSFVPHAIKIFPVSKFVIFKWETRTAQRARFVEVQQLGRVGWLNSVKLPTKAISIVKVESYVKHKQGTEDSSLTFFLSNPIKIANIYFQISDKQTKMVPNMSSNTERHFSVTAKYTELEF